MGKGWITTLLILVILASAQINCGCTSNSKADASVIKSHGEHGEVALTITPDEWNGYGLFETISFKCSAVWEDGTEDPNCSHANPPKWTVEDCGVIVGSNTGNQVNWNSEHGPCNGTISVEYAGTTKTVEIVTTMPERITPAFWSHIELPYITDTALKTYFYYTKAQWDKFYRQQMDSAQDLSDMLEDYIRGWFNGNNPATIPEGLLPDTIDNIKTHSWTLLKPEEVIAEDQWYYYPAREEPSVNGFSALHKNNAATHVTYLKTHWIAPIGTELVIEGDFPRCRFMSYQISPPFDPRHPYFGNRGTMEVPLVDVDIIPDEGHTNPFHIGADRNAEKRHYLVCFDLEAGNMTELNEVMHDNHFRAQGNRRVGGPFCPSGPCGKGSITPGVMWLRYYVPDEGLEPLAGVNLPKAMLRLKTGEEFWIQPDYSFAAQRQLKTVPGVRTFPNEPPEFIGSSFGWFKMFSIYQLYAEALGYHKLAEPYGEYPIEGVRKLIRNEMEFFNGRGIHLPSPGNIAHSATDCPYNSYLSRPMAFGRNRIYALTGRIPTTPKTRSGETTMERAEARYWSLSHTGGGPENIYNGVVYGSLLDEDVVVDDNNDYIIVISHKRDKPDNATSENGVTWVELGDESNQGFCMRWMSVYPDHYMEEHAPNDINIPWKSGAWSQDEYDVTLVGKNKPGVMGPYHPIVHYMTVSEFEALGDGFDSSDIPEWTN